IPECIGREAEVGFFHYLPAQRGEHIRGLCTGHHHPVEYGVDHIGRSGTVRSLDPVIPETAPAAATLQIIQRSRRETFLFRDHPSGSDSRKITPFLLIFTAAIGTKSTIQEILMIEIVSYPSEIRHAVLI